MKVFKKDFQQQHNYRRLLQISLIIESFRGSSLIQHEFKRWNILQNLEMKPTLPLWLRTKGSRAGSPAPGQSSFPYVDVFCFTNLRGYIIESYKNDLSPFEVSAVGCGVGSCWLRQLFVVLLAGLLHWLARSRDLRRPPPPPQCIYYTTGSTQRERPARGPHPVESGPSQFESGDVMNQSSERSERTESCRQALGRYIRIQDVTAPFSFCFAWTSAAP